MNIKDLRKLEEQEVNSSWIKDLTSTGKHVTMSLDNGKAYQILDMPPEDFEQWTNSPSKGTYYNTKVRNDYIVNRVN